MTVNPSSESGHLSIEQHPDIKALGVPATTSRDSVVPALHAVTLLAGMYAAISAWVVGFTSQPPLATSDLIVGIGVALLAFTALRQETRALPPVAAALGVWLIIAPWIVQHIDLTASMWVSNLVAGVVVLLASGSAAAMLLRNGRHARR